MIEKIGLSTNVKSFAYNDSSVQKKKINKENFQTEVLPNTKFSPQYLQKYYVNFKAKKVGNLDKNELLKNNLSPYSKAILTDASSLAYACGDNKISQEHVLRVVLEYINQYIDELDSGERIYATETTFSSPYVLEEELTPKVFRLPELRAKIKPVIENEIEILDEEFEERAGKKKTNEKKLPEGTILPLKEDFLNDIYSIFVADNKSPDGSGAGQVTDSQLFDCAFTPSDDEINYAYSMPFKDELNNAVRIDNRAMEARIHIPFYDDKAKNIWKNLSVGTNMIILHEKDITPRYLLNSIMNVFEKSDNGFGRLKKENTRLVFFNEYSKLSHLLELAQNCANEKDKNYVFVADINNTLVNTFNAETRAALLANNTPIGFAEDSVDVFKSLPPNIKFIFTSDKDSYFSMKEMTSAKKVFSSYGEVSMPMINIAEAKKMFRDVPELTAKIKKHFSPPAVQKCVEISNQLDGYYPEKTQKLMELISAYYIDKEKDISLSDVQNYIKEAKDVFKSTEDESSVKLIFDTEVKLKDMVGMPSTKKEAESIVERIKNKTIGTKGFVIYSQDGSVGSGRKYTAQAIAGQAKIPYIEINAVDFGTEKVDLFGGSNMSSEASMKKLFGLAKAQAETNPYKAAVVFVENFEDFSIGEQVYGEKAMSQMLREMDNAQKQGLNILVFGSTRDPEYISESVSKSFKFIDLIEVESPYANKSSRKEIIDYYIKKKNLKIAGNTPEEKASIIESVADTTVYSSFIEILTLLDKAKNVSKERKHKAIDKSDFTEAYMQLTSGRPAVKNIPEYSKRIVTSHECGHALNLTVMHNLAKNENIPWHLPNKVNFITLDPRGDYGGCMYHKNTDNTQMSFEKIFGDIVCDFGGHSCEKRFYGMDGSYGISQDMNMATNLALEAVGVMGQGKYYGKKSLVGAIATLTEKEKNIINKDIDVMLKNGEKASNLITETYEDFVKEFTEKYYGKVGTGESLISGEVFEKELQEWKAKQSESKQEELKITDDMLLDIIRYAKEGKIYP